MVTEDAVAETLVCGPDPEKHVEAIKEYADAGYDHICVHQVGPDQKGFLRFFERDGLPELGVTEQRPSAGATDPPPSVEIGGEQTPLARPRLLRRRADSTAPTRARA